MKIMHLCLANYYIDGYGYQENLITRMHKLLGYDVRIVASTETYINNVSLGYVEPRNYMTEDGIPIHRIPYKHGIPTKLVHKLRLYEGLTNELNEFQPDIIFMHDMQFLSVKEVANYLDKHKNVKLFVDSHTDYRNSAKTFLSKYFLHKIIYQHCANIIEPYTIKFYGTLPSRVDFYTNFYGLSKEKTEFLPMGADDECVKLAKETNQRQLIRTKYGIKDDEFLVISGGKFNERKREILNAMKAVSSINKSKKIKMLIFGSIQGDEFVKEFNALCDGKAITHTGWIKGNESYNYYEAADLVVFPGLHSVLWEQAVGQGKPCIFKYMEGFTHVDLGGNCEFLHQSTVEEIESTINKCMDNYPHMLEVAKEKGMLRFSYYKIAEMAIAPATS